MSVGSLGHALALADPNPTPGMRMILSPGAAVLIGASGSDV